MTPREVKERVKIAFRNLRRFSYVCRMNFTDCSSCATSELDVYLKKHPEKMGAVYYHHRNEDDLQHGKILYLSYFRRVYNSEADQMLANDIVIELKAAGLNVLWDGSPSTKIGILQ